MQRYHSECLSLGPIFIIVYMYDVTLKGIHDLEAPCSYCGKSRSGWRYPTFSMRGMKLCNNIILLDKNYVSSSHSLEMQTMLLRVGSHCDFVSVHGIRQDTLKKQYPDVYCGGAAAYP